MIGPDVEPRTRRRCPGRRRWRDPGWPRTDSRRPSGAVIRTSTVASRSGSNAALRATHADRQGRPRRRAGRDARSARDRRPGSASQRSACFQKVSKARSVAGMSMRQRHDASPAKTIDRPSPNRWTATSARGVPPGTAGHRQHAGARSRAAKRRNGGQRRHRLPSLPGIVRLPAPSCITGWASPAAVSETRLTPRPAAGATSSRRPQPRAGSTAVPAVAELERQHVLERASAKALAQKRARAEHEQAAATLADERAGGFELGTRELMRLDVGEHERVVAEQRLARWPGNPRTGCRCEIAPPEHRTCQRPARSCLCERPNRLRARIGGPVRA